MISDFLGPINWMRPLRAIAGRHEVLGIEVLDPRDVELPRRGRCDPAGHRIGCHPGVHHRRAVACRLREGRGQAHGDEVARTLRRCGAPLLTLRTDRDWIADIVRFVAAAAARWPAAMTPSDPRLWHERLRTDTTQLLMTLPLLGPMSLTRLRTPVVLPVPPRDPRADRALHRRAAGAAASACCGSPTWSCWKALRPNGLRGGVTCRRSCWCCRCVVHRRDGRADARRPDPAQPRRGDAGDRRVAVDAGHRHRAEPAGRRAGGRQEVRRRADARHQPRPDLLRGHRHGAGVADHQPRRHQGRHRQAAAGRPHRHR